ncbi:MAG: hypothetical protein ACQEXJ_19865 [Myxococcota bacterium]
MDPVIVMACYRPRAQPGAADRIEELLVDHVRVLRDKGWITDRKPILCRALDGTYVEILEWREPDTIERAHRDHDVAEVRDQMGHVAEFVHVADLAEAERPYAEMEHLNLL